MTTPAPAKRNYRPRTHNDHDLASTGAKIRDLRISRGVTQPQLAEALGFKQHSSIANIEAGRRAISDSKLIKAARFLSFDPRSVRPYPIDVAMALSEVDAERFWPKVEQTESCWNWTAATANGYGRFSYAGKLQPAHRFAYEMVHGPIPSGMMVDHICHNTLCVNPAHLRLATHKQNGEHRKDADADSKSGVRGVTWNPAFKVWQARVGHNNRVINVGSYQTLVEAEAAVKAIRNALFTHNNADRPAEINA